ncbi:hypothetical protein ASG89_01200 [Paenibacillus sp. Soil766]|uniref:hypothetical protein n=1 Tax=Paenibacillus sp. Soil766 TaxID=1736404 RepID=UPI0007090C37|nr:hypothetical protein [Paenibacillus sp. Soil766]KRF10185.1 hypothetical protein ASG89_01200 [Paenibacillus sp. Soil766]
MVYTKAVIKEPYYDCPVWIDSDIIRKAHVILTESSSTKEVELFLVHLFGYNNIDVKESFEKSFKQLFDEDEVVILGGIAFFEDEDKFILPSCCCGLEDLVLVNESIINKVSPWLGHDPNPGIEYSNNGIVKVWSDEPSKENVFFIEFKYDELIHALEDTKKELLGFIEKPLYQWLDHRDKFIANEMVRKMKQWFLKEENCL